MIDMEHSPNDLTSVLGQLQAFAAYGTTYRDGAARMERCSAGQAPPAGRVGASGLLFPMVQSVEEAKKAVAATRYPPHGIRGVSTSTRANKFGRVTDYFTRSEGELAVLLQVETRAAVNLASQIGSVQGCDGFSSARRILAPTWAFWASLTIPISGTSSLPVARRLIAEKAFRLVRWSATPLSRANCWTRVHLRRLRR